MLVTTLPQLRATQQLYQGVLKGSTHFDGIGVWGPTMIQDMMPGLFPGGQAVKVMPPL